MNKENCALKLVDEIIQRKCSLSPETCNVFENDSLLCSKFSINEDLKISLILWGYND